MKIAEGNHIKYQAYSYPFYAAHEHDMAMSENDIISAAVVDCEDFPSHVALFDTVEEACAHIDQCVQKAPEATARRERVRRDGRIGSSKIVLRGDFFFVREVEVDDDDYVVDYGDDLAERVSSKYVIPFSEVEDQKVILELFREIPEEDREGTDEDDIFLPEIVEEYAKGDREYAEKVLCQYGIEF